MDGLCSFTDIRVYSALGGWLCWVGLDLEAIMMGKGVMGVRGEGETFGHFAPRSIIICSLCRFRAACEQMTDTIDPWLPKTCSGNIAARQTSTSGLVEAYDDIILEYLSATSSQPSFRGCINQVLSQFSPMITTGILFGKNDHHRSNFR